MKQITELHRKGHAGDDYLSSANTPDHSTMVFGTNSVPRPFSFMSNRTNFALLPAASVAAGSDKLLLLSGTGTEVVARSTAAKGGGVNIKTQATTPLATNNVILAGVTATAFVQALSVNTLPRFSARLSLANVATVIGSFGLSELLTDADPKGTAGEGVLLLADPTEAVTTGLTTAQHANWIIAFKVNGDDTFAATTIPLVADKPYDVDIQLNDDLTASVYIGGTLVATSPALTSGDSVAPFFALETTSDAQKDADIRFCEFGPTVVL